MKIGIIGAMSEEVALLRVSIVDQTIHEAFGYSFIEGTLGGKLVVLVQSGIGKVNATISASLLIQLFEVDLIINTGTAGAVDSGLDVGDIVIGQSLLQHDVDVSGFGYELGQMAGMPEMYYPDTRVMRLAQETIRTFDIEPVLGLIVSGDEFVNSTERIKEIKNKFPKARACEMESAAIAQTAYVMGVPFVVIRVISDNADHTAAVSFDDFVEQVSDATAQMVISLVAAV